MLIIALCTAGAALAGGSFGVRLGAASAELVSDVSAEPRHGVTGGVFFTVALDAYLDASIELLYLPRGAEDVLTGRTRGYLAGPTDIYTRVRYHYLEVPFLVRLHLPGRGLHALLGPSLGIALAEELEYAEAYADEIEPHDATRSDFDYRAYGVYGTLPTVDASICLGGGYGRRIGMTDVSVDARLYVGLRNLTKYGRTVRNRTLTISLAVGI